MTVDRVWRIAVHESSHAALARLLGLPAGGASIIEPNARAHFACNLGWPSIVALMAGAAAEQVAFGGYDRDGVRIDKKRWKERLDYFGYSSGQLWDHTIELVRANFSTIEILAHQLQRDRVLTGSHIDLIVRRW